MGSTHFQRLVHRIDDEARVDDLSLQRLVAHAEAFQFDPEAAKDIDELTPAKTGMLFLKSQMNTDLLTDDLKKKRSSNESFWLIGQPDIVVQPIGDGEDKGKYRITVNGFDY